MADDLADVPTDFLVSYFETQINRVSQVEQMRLQFTNIVAAASVVAVAILAGNETGQRIHLLVLLTVFVSNLIAVGFVYRLKEHVAQHEVRVQRVLQSVSTGLLDLHLATNTKSRRIHSINMYQVYLHLALASLTLVAALLV